MHTGRYTGRYTPIVQNNPTSFVASVHKQKPKILRNLRTVICKTPLKSDKVKKHLVDGGDGVDIEKLRRSLMDAFEPFLSNNTTSENSGVSSNPTATTTIASDVLQKGV